MFYFHYKGTFSESKEFTSLNLSGTNPGELSTRRYPLDPLAVLHLDNGLYMSAYSLMKRCCVLAGKKNLKNPRTYYYSY